MRLWLFGLLAAPALARVGGGESFSGGGGGSSGDGDAGAIYFFVRLLIELCFYHPAIGIPLLLAVVVGAYFYYNRPTARLEEWSNRVTPNRQRSTPVRDLQAVDPNFSRPLFMDFIGLLYTRALSRVGNLDAYLAPRVREKLALSDGVTSVDEVIVGSARLVSVTGLREERTALTVELETNFTEHRAGGPRLVYSVESWVLERRTGVLSKGPEEIMKLACPSCGNPGEPGPDGKCPFCDKLITDGSYDWLVIDIQVKNRVERPPMVVGGSGQELGTDLPTVFQPDFGTRAKAFQTAHPDFSWPEFDQRARHIFLTLQAAWSAGTWETVRPYETDSLFATHRYWLTSLERQGLRNVLEDVFVEETVGVRIDSDAYYDALTLRIFARMKDYTVNREGAVVGGSRTTPRRFSEYWTFIRRTGSRARATDPGRCPSCGAELDKVNMAGICEYCGSKITSGDFDWVLSRIEQDEAYEA